MNGSQQNENIISEDEDLSDDNENLFNNCVDDFSVEDKNYFNVANELETMKEKKFRYEKSILVKHLQKKIDGIEQRMRYINHKYSDYQKIYKLMNVFVIILSSMLTLFEALTNMLDIESMNTFSKTLFGISSLVLSTMISLLATLIKFQKYQEHMEALSVTEEKGIIAISKLKRVREMIYFAKNMKHFNIIKKTYLDETYQFYNEVNIKIEIELDEEDYIKYYKKMSNTDVNLGKVYINKFDSIRDIIDDHNKIDNYLKYKKKYQGNDLPFDETSSDKHIIKSKKEKMSCCGSKNSSNTLPPLKYQSRGRDFERDTNRNRNRSITPPFALTPTRRSPRYDSQQNPPPQNDSQPNPPPQNDAQPNNAQPNDAQPNPPPQNNPEPNDAQPNPPPQNNPEPNDAQPNPPPQNNPEPNDAQPNDAQPNDPPPQNNPQANDVPLNDAQPNNAQNL